MNRFHRVLSACVAALLLSACSEREAPPAVAAVPAAAAVAAPADPALARLYEQTCKTCHGAPGTGAPLTGDAAAWASRSAQGLEVLVEHTVSGFKGMPPLGSCADCSEDDFVALIRYMAQLP